MLTNQKRGFMNVVHIPRMSSQHEPMPQQKLAGLQQAIESEIIGQHELIQQMLICLLCDGHILMKV